MTPAIRDLASRVVEDGTDPDRLGRVLATRVEEQTSLTRAIEDAGDTGQDVGVALDDVAGARLPLDDDRVVALLETWDRLGVRACLAGDPAYPTRLLAHPGPPVVLARRGPPALAPGVPVVAIVGSRRASDYGRGVAAWLAEAASDAGARVVSGGARGIDAAAHDAALDGRGGTTVVLGCGHDVPYPRPHATPGGLFDRVLQRDGTILSEFLPGEAVRPFRVRARNRIVAGLADAVVVVEGGERSGTLITATDAADRGVTVLAVPGDVRAPGSAAPHRLLAEGAAVCRDPDDLLDALGLAAAARDTGSDPTRPASRPTGLPDRVEAVLAAAWPRPVELDDLAHRSGTSAGSLLATLTRARIAGTVVVAPDGVRLSRNPSLTPASSRPT